jgi:hypothetical protein
MSKYLLVQKERVLVERECRLTIPLSHLFDIKAEALQWGLERGMMAEAEVWPVGRGLKEWGYGFVV